MTKDGFWAKYDVGRIVTEATMLDIRNLSIGLRERYVLEAKNPGSTINPGESATDLPGAQVEDGAKEAEEAIQLIKPIDLSSGKAVISLQDMIEASVALKTNIDLEIRKPVSSPKCGFMSRSDVTDVVPPPSPTEESSGASENPSHVREAISGLQREVLLLRNELNFELWHSRENSKHIGRLYKDRILMRTAESERQGLVRACILSLIKHRD